MQKQLKLSMISLILLILCIISFLIININPLELTGKTTNIIEISQLNTSDSSGKSNIEDKISGEPSYLMINTDSKEILLSLNSDMTRPPASTTKLLTGLLVIEGLKLEEKVIVGKEVDVEGSGMGLFPGDEITVHDLLRAMFIASANDAAAALAVKISGSIENFSKKMNERAEALGCKSSNFLTPHGLPTPLQYTSAADMSIIGMEFAKNKTLMKYVQEKNATIRWKNSIGGTRSVSLTNTNKILNVYPGDIGLKTGTTQEAGQCLVSYIERPDGNVILSLLGSEQRYRDTVKLLDEGYAKLRLEKAKRNISIDSKNLTTIPGFYTQ